MFPLAKRRESVYNKNGLVLQPQSRKGSLVAMIHSIMPLASLFSGEQAGQVQETAVTGGFGNIFQSAVEAVKETDAEKTQMQYLMATGQLDNPAELTLASSKYELSVNLLVQLRNRALEAYNEIMRISL